MRFFQEAYDAECAAIARALAVAAERTKRRKLCRVRIFTDAQAAITRITYYEPGPGQTYALQARKAIAALRERGPSVEIEISSCPGHKGSRGTRPRTDWPRRPPASRMTTGSRLALANGARIPSWPTLPSASDAQGIGEVVAGSPVVVRAETIQQGVRPPGERQA